MTGEAGFSMDEPVQLTPEILVPMLGEYLIQSKLIDEDQLQLALAYQQEQLEKGRSCLLGQALVEMGVLNRAQLDQAITEQILQLRSALQDANHNLEKRVEERTAELQEALRKLSELNQLKANFVANVSHELRTPLTHIKGYLELLITHALGSINDDQYKAIEVSQRSTGRLESLIDDLILFSLASRGELTLQLKPVEIQSIVDRIIPQAQVKAAERNITLNVAVEEELPVIQADEEKISWAISQLIDNAIKFTPPGGSTELAIRTEGDGLVEVSVSDTGIGIPQNRLDEIFEPFHQLDGSSTRRYGGTGMGLTLVKQIIDAHGSLIDVQSSVHQGTTFTFQLVAAPTSQAAL